MMESVSVCLSVCRPAGSQDVRYLVLISLDGVGVAGLDEVEEVSFFYIVVARIELLDEAWQ